MDADLLSGMIGELILDRDTLSLPGLGTFVAEDMPASFSDRGYTINPPYRRLSFSERITDDGVLAALYARDNAIDPDEANAILSGYLVELAKDIREQGSVELAGLGRLRATRDGHFFFVPDENLDISPDTCGLGPVSLKTHGAGLSSLSAIAPLQSPAPSGSKTDNPAAGVSEVPDPGASESSIPEPGPVVPAAPRRRFPKPLAFAAGAFAAVALLIAAFAALSRIAPDFTDRLLYTQEELEILNYPEDGLGLPG